MGAHNNSFSNNSNMNNSLNNNNNNNTDNIINNPDKGIDSSILVPVIPTIEGGCNGDEYKSKGKDNIFVSKNETNQLFPKKK